MNLVTDHETRLVLRKKNNMEAVPLHIIPSLLVPCATDTSWVQVLTTDSITELENKPSRVQEILLHVW